MSVKSTTVSEFKFVCDLISCDRTTTVYGALTDETWPNGWIRFGDKEFHDLEHLADHLAFSLAVILNVTAVALEVHIDRDGKGERIDTGWKRRDL